MKILFLTENYPPESNAAASRVYERAVYWAEWGHDVTILTTAPNYPKGEVYPGYENKWRHVENIDGIRVVRVKSYISGHGRMSLRVLDFLSFMATSFIFGIFEKKPDVIVATSPQFFTAVGGWALSAVKRKPFVFELGDLWPSFIEAVGVMKKNIIFMLMEKLELFLYDRSACVIALTKAFKKDLMERGVPGSKIAVIINGVEVKKYSPIPKDESIEIKLGLKGKFVAGYIGTLGMAHGLENVLDAAEMMRDHSDITFLLVGSGAHRARLEADAKRRGLVNVVFLIAQPKEEIKKYWSVCDVALVHLAANNVFSTVIPSKIFEAMGMGKAIIISAPKGEANNIIERENAGIWTPAGDPKRLMEAVVQLKEDKKSLKDYAFNSMKAASKYSRELQAAKMIEALEAAGRGQGHIIGEMQSWD